MKIRTNISQNLNEQGRRINWLADSMKVSRQELDNKLKGRSSFSKEQVLFLMNDELLSLDEDRMVRISDYVWDQNEDVRFKLEGEKVRVIYKTEEVI